MVNSLSKKHLQENDFENSKEKSKNVGGFSTFLEKIKSIKHIKLIILTLVLAIILLIGVSIYDNKKKVVDSLYQPTQLTDLENKLAKMLSEIKGAGKVSVMIMFDGGIEYVTANSTQTTTNKVTDNSGGVDRITENISESTTPIIINENGQSKPIIIKEIMPEILGVMIVAEGAQNVLVRMDLIRAAAKILNIDSWLIEVFVAEQK